MFATTQVYTSFGTKANATDVTTALALKANITDVYAKTQVIHR